jgi:hypothetical protein
MSNKATDYTVIAEEIIEELTARAEQVRSEKVDAIAEKWVETETGICRVAVCSSAYGIHFEIGPLQGSKPKQTKVFAGSDKDSAIALLLRYMHA